MNDAQQDTKTLAGRWEEIAEGLLSMEELSLGMISCPGEVLVQKAARRGELVERIRALQEACEEREPLDAAEAARVSAAQDTARAAVCRMQDIDRQVVARMKREQERILEKLRTVGKSAGAHASRYYQAQAPAQHSIFHGSI